jgi:ABC-type bacteriocin/lantibiotic exporter with double-glycine peptidase domain
MPEPQDFNELARQAWELTKNQEVPIKPMPAAGGELKAVVPAPVPAPLWPRITPMAQHNSVSCGQTSVAVIANYLMGLNPPINDTYINSHFGFALLSALNKLCAPKYHWDDAGDLNHSMWADLEHRCRNGFPAVIFLNGEYSVTGRGHIMVISKIEGDVVTLIDPNGNEWGTEHVSATGVRITHKKNMELCPPHPDGKAVFVCSKAKQYMGHV